MAAAATCKGAFCVVVAPEAPGLGCAAVLPLTDGQDPRRPWNQAAGEFEPEAEEEEEEEAGPAEAKQEQQQPDQPVPKVPGPSAAKRPAAIKSNTPLIGGGAAAAVAARPQPLQAQPQAKQPQPQDARKAAAAEQARRLVEEMKAADAPPPQGSRRIKGPATMPPPKFGATPDGGASAPDVRAAAAARVAASVALLAGAGARQWEEDGGAEGQGQLQQQDRGAADTEMADAWVPPSGQSGDGRTALNEKLGY